MFTLFLVAALVALLVAATPQLRVAQARHRSRSIARRRGVYDLAYSVRVTPELDLNLDLSTATEAQLDAQRVATINAIGQGATSELVQRAEAISAAISQRNELTARANAARQALVGSNVARTGNVPPVVEDEQQRLNQPDPADLPLHRAAYANEHFRAYDGRGSVRVEIEQRALFGTAEFPSQPTRVPGVQQPNRDTPLTVLDLIDRQQIGTNTVEWVQETGYPNNAGTVAEGGVKPESSAAFQLVQDTARTIAHWVKFTRQVLEDEPQVQGYIRGRLTYGLLRKLNQQIIDGDGVSPNLRGILNASGIGTYTAAAGESPLVSIRRARTVAELSEYAPDTVVLNPLDWERVELTADANGQFVVVANAVANGAAPRVWGLNVVVTTNVTGSTADPDGAGAGVAVAGTFLLGAFREGATLWERTGVQLYMTDSHASDFTSNLITLLAELRAVLSVWAPKAFVRGTFTAPA